MSRYLSEKLSAEVVSRAGNRCEYCLIAIDDTYFGGEIDHIRSLKHGGKSDLDNLALACQFCNRNKGSDLGSISAQTGDLVRFFDPRVDRWIDHFSLNEAGEIVPLTDKGEVTTRILGFNHPERVTERLGLIELGRFNRLSDDK